MKVQLDTELKTIKVEGIVNLGELVSYLENWLPNELWKEYKLETNTTIVGWSSPIVVPYYPRPYTNPYPWWDYYSTCYNENGPSTVFSNSNGIGNRVLNNGTYNIECKGVTSQI